MMRCPVCGAPNSRFVKARPKVTEDGDMFVHRRRECIHCGHRFSTFECYEVADTEAIFKARNALAFVRSAERELTSIR